MLYLSLFCFEKSNRNQIGYCWFTWCISKSTAEGTCTFSSRCKPRWMKRMKPIKSWHCEEKKSCETRQEAVGDWTVLKRALTDPSPFISRMKRIAFQAQSWNTFPTLSCPNGLANIMRLINFTSTPGAIGVWSKKSPNNSHMTLHKGRLPEENEISLYQGSLLHSQPILEHRRMQEILENRKVFYNSGLLSDSNSLVVSSNY